jgi:hypothetical protein
MTPYEIFTIAGVFLGIGIGVFNYLDKRRNTSLTGVSVSADANKDLNESVAIAYSRAHAAELEMAQAEKEHDKELAQLREDFRIEFECLRVKNEELHEEIIILRKQIETIAYEINLIAHLGEEPKIEKVFIRRISTEKTG